MSLKNISVIGVDLDGTLYTQSNEMQGRIREKIYDRLGLELDIPLDAASELFEEEYNGNFPWSHSGSRTIEELGKRVDRRLDGKGIVQQSIEQADILDLIPPNPEVNGMLGRLGTRFNLDLITSTSYDLAYAKLKKIGIDEGKFTQIFAEGKYGSKSSGEAYRHWIEKRNTLPEQMLYVGDNKKQDIEVPNSAGIRTCFIGEYSDADYSIENILDLETLLK